jgi:two-component system, chemotaxis family, response regulator Rcp1
MSHHAAMSQIEILLVEDNPGDVVLVQEAFKDFCIPNCLHVAEDGVEALAFLHREGKYQEAVRPDLIILDLNLPRKSGQQVLAEVKTDETLRSIPVVILTSSEAEDDISRAYYLYANCYITKPIVFDTFLSVIKTIEEFWFTVVRLPTR